MKFKLLLTLSLFPQLSKKYYRKFSEKYKLVLTLLTKYQPSQSYGLKTVLDLVKERLLVSFARMLKFFYLDYRASIEGCFYFTGYFHPNSCFMFFTL